jgi:hypothetical protein
MPTFTIDAPNGKSYTIDGANAEGALAALRKHIGESGDRPQSSPLGDFVKSIPRGAMSGLATAASALGRTAEAEMGRPEDAEIAPTAEQGMAAMEQNVTGPLHQPEGRAGKFGESVGQFVGNPASYVAPGSLATRIGMAILSGLGSEAGGQIGEGTAAEGPLRVGGAIVGGMAGAKLGQPLDVRAAIGAKPSAQAPSIPELDAAYRSVRNSPEIKGATVPIGNVERLASEAEQELLARGNRPTQGSAPRTFGELEGLTPKPPAQPTPQQRLQAEMNWEKLPESPRVANASVDDLLAAKRGFGNVAGERKPFPLMGPTEDAGAASTVIRKLDDLIEEAAPGMKDANANYSAARASEAIDKRIQKAEMRASTNNSGMNIGNKIRQQAATILENGAAKRGLKPEEIDALEQVAYGTPTRNAIRYASNLFGGGGGLGAVVTGEVGSHTLGAVGWALAPLGHVLKHLENHLTVRAANNVSEAIRSRSPLGQALQSSAQKWNDARDAFLAGPSTAKIAAFSIASRNLANTLSGAGAKIDPKDLLRSLQGPRPATAQGEQQ